MTNHVRIFESHRTRFASLLLAVLLALLVGVGLPRPDAHAQDDPPAAEPPPTASEAQEAPSLDSLRKAVKAQREKMELAFQAVEQDFALVKGGTFAKHPGKGSVKAARAVVVAARQNAEAASEELAAAALSYFGAADGDLSRSSLLIVLARVAEGARADEKADATALLTKSATELFAFDSADLAWDGPFQKLPVVKAFRSAQLKLEAAEEKARAAKAANAPGSPGQEADMVFFPRGRGQVGPWSGWVQVFSEKTNKRQNATRKPIYVDRYEVSCAQFGAFVNAQKANKRAALLPKGWKLTEDGSVEIPDGRARHPVTGVSYAQALAYARHWGKRLPFEDEWELVAAGLEKVGRVYPWGPQAGERKLGTKTAGIKATSAVDAFPDDVTPEGVVGLAGNVAEYVATQPDRTDLPRLKEPKSAEIIVRGGSFKSIVEEATTTYRWIADPAEGAAHVGFRCVMSELDYKRKFEK